MAVTGRLLTLPAARLHVEVDGKSIQFAADGQSLQGVFSTVGIRPADDAAPMDLRFSCDGLDLSSLVQLLPESLQQAATRLSLDGCVTGEVEARVPRDEWLSADAWFHVALAPLAVAPAGTCLNWQQLLIDGRVDRGSLSAHLSGDVDGATVDAMVDADSHSSRPMRVDLNASNLQATLLQSLLRAGAQAPLLAATGICNVRGTAEIWTDHSARFSFDGRADSPELTVSAANRTIQLSDVSAACSGDRSRLTCRVEAGGLGGRFRASGGWDAANPAEVPLETEFTAIELESIHALLSDAPSVSGGRPAAHVTGRATGRFQGTVDRRTSLGLVGSGQAELVNVALSVAGSTLHFKPIRCQADVAAAHVKCLAVSDVLGGETRVNAQWSPLGDQPLELTWTVDDADLRELSALLGPRASAYLGRVSSGGSASASLRDWPKSLTGAGSARLREAQFTHLPILADLVGIVGGRLIPAVTEPADTAEATFRLASDSVELVSLRATSLLFDVHGAGRLQYDGALDVVLRGGPLRKVESLLGPVGAAIGRVTEKAVEYRVSGSIRAPRVTVHPLGLGDR